MSARSRSEPWWGPRVVPRTLRWSRCLAELLERTARAALPPTLHITFRGSPYPPEQAAYLKWLTK